MEVSGLRFLGRGVAYDLRSPELRACARGSRPAWEPWLTPQDRQGFRPHVTVQNKVAPDAGPGAARRARRPASRRTSCGREGLALWRYLGGPWEPAASFRADPGVA